VPINKEEYKEDRPMPTWVIPQSLARSSRPGYSGECGRSVSIAEVDAWIAEVRALGVKSIVCLLADNQLPLYSQLPSDLVSYYRNAGFSVKHVPAQDRREPPLSQDQMERVWAAYQELPKPVLVHCSAGCDRTGQAVAGIERRLMKEG
jgi:protein tyrosine phosphatase (PTP) superfamily phosphohydrolase (DUF442 family)